MVDRYLASPAYGERMAMDWLDLARYADTYGYQNDFERDMSAYRDWVIEAFNRNLPYDQFLTWQLAGDLLPNATREQRIATAFNRLHRQTNEGGSVEEEFRTEYVVDRVNTFGTAMLGLTVECARCHDHRFDPITQRDYYGLFAFFNNIDESGLYSHFTAATPSPSLLLWPAGKEEEHQRLTAKMRALEAQIREMSRAARKAFDAQPKRPIEPPAPISHLAFDRVDGDKTPDSVLPRAAELRDAPVHSGRTRRLRFSGDNSVVHPGAPIFKRTDPFSFALRLQPTELQDRAVVFHQSRAWTDAGSRGFELTLDRGRPVFALVHFWPGNAVAVRAVKPLPLAAWSQLVITYDGSSRAAGIRLYLNGAPVATEVIRDRLYKDITYDPAAGDNVGEQPRLTIGARFRDSGFKNGLIDDLQIFSTELTAAEVTVMAGQRPSSAAAFEHFLARSYEPRIAAVAELGRLRTAENALVAAVPEIMVMEEMRTPRPAHRLDRGAYDAPREIVARDTPASLPPFPKGQPRNRLGLARWLTGRDNPLAARVAVNRLWRMHFGRGIVATQEDFGSQGRLPTHPELLDYLAARFVESGWDVKALHRLIVSSATFQQSSHVPAGIAARDPDNQLLARGPKRRLAAESIRDSALAASGLLNRTIGGPQREAVSTRGSLGAGRHRQDLQAGHRREPVPPQPVHLLEAHVAAAVDGHVRRDVARGVHGQARSDDHAAAVAGAAERSAVRRGGAARRGTRAEALSRGCGGAQPAGVPRLIGRLPDEVEAGILARLFEEQRALFAVRAEDAARLLAVGDAARRSGARSRGPGGADDGRERGHEFRRVRGGAVRSVDSCQLPAASFQLSTGW